MSNIVSIFNTAFEPEQVKAMGTAYDVITATFPADDHEAVALEILSAAATGEKDPEKLCDLALQALSAEEILHPPDAKRQVP